jgi:hypothetical protein
LGSFETGNSSGLGAESLAGRRKPVKALSSLAILALVGAVSMVATPAGAQHPEAPTPDFDSPAPAVEGSTAFSEPTFGPNWEWKVYHASRFVPWWGASTPDYASSGYLQPAADGDQWWTQVDLPAGSQIIAVMWQIYDGTATGRFSGLRLSRYQAARSGTVPDWETIQDQQTDQAGTPGYQLLQISDGLPVTVRAYEDIDGAGGQDFTAYALNAFTDGTPLGDLRLFGATVVWQRTLSPAPAVASFGDVPTGFWAFAHIEALVDSGITAGCGGGNYCPGNPVTRDQMAVFLAAAMGLHWPF